MPLGSVLVIEDDEWVSSLLSAAIREAGYDVVVCSFAQEGLDTACADHPDCIICDVDLPDHDGYWVARNVRTHPSRVSVTPFLFLSSLDDEQSRLEGFHVGADVYMTKPFRVDEVVAQIGALVQMAERLRVRRDSMMSLPPPSVASAIEGDLGQMSIATVLTVLEMERRTGVFEVVSKKRRAHLQMVRGGVIDGTVGGTKVSALTALRTMLMWTVGRFSFKPRLPEAGEGAQSNKSLGAFLIEALRLQDEAARDGLDIIPASIRRPAPGDIRLAPPALGGPASTPADFAPPSSRTPDFARGSSPSGEPSSRPSRKAPFPLPVPLPVPVPTAEPSSAPSRRIPLPSPHAEASSASSRKAPLLDLAPPRPATPPPMPAPARAATPAPPAPLLSLEPDLADWEIPESMTPAAGPAVPLPKPPPLTLPRMAAVRLPTDPVIPRPASMTPVPTPPLPGSPRVGGILPSAPVPRERTLPPRPAGRVDPQKKE